MSAVAVHTTREQWLQAVCERVAPLFAAQGHALPAVRVSVGFTSRGARSNRIGEHWSPGASSDAVSQIFIHPSRVDSVDVAHILVHELCHAVHPHDGHGKLFGKLARALGLEGPLTATVPGDALRDSLAPIIAELGDYPHVKLDTSGASKQSTRMLKVQCIGEADDDGQMTGCGCIIRMTSRWLNTVGAPTCGCGVPMDCVD